MRRKAIGPRCCVTHVKEVQLSLYCAKPPCSSLVLRIRSHDSNVAHITCRKHNMLQRQERHRVADMRDLYKKPLLLLLLILQWIPVNALIPVICPNGIQEILNTKVPSKSLLFIFDDCGDILDMTWKQKGQTHKHFLLIIFYLIVWIDQTEGSVVHAATPYTKSNKNTTEPDRARRTKNFCFMKRGEPLKSCMPGKV